MKKALKYILFSFVGLLLAAIMLPFVFEDDLQQFLKEEVNKQINGEIAFEDLNLSLIKSFPRVQIDLEDLTIRSDFDKDQDTLAQVGLVSLNLNVMDLIKRSQDIAIHSFTLKDADISIYQPRHGKSNYELLKEDDAQKDGSGLSYSINLDEYFLKNVNLSFVNELDQLTSSFVGINHEGSGNFSQSQFDLNTITRINEINVEVQNTKYLDDLSFDMKSQIYVDQDNDTYKVEAGEFTLGDLIMLGDATVVNQKNGLDIDANFKSADQSFKNYLRLVPGIFRSNIDKLNASGSSSLELNVDGIFANNSYPAFNLEVKASNGKINVEDVKEEIKDIDLHLMASSSKKDLSDFMVNVPNLKFKIEDQSVSGNFKTQNILVDPNYSGKINADVDLQKLNNIIKIESLESLSGKFKSDVTFNVTQSDILKANYQNMTVNGSAEGEDLKMEMAGSPTFYIPQANMTFDPNKSNFQLNNMELGQSRMSVEGDVENLMALLSDETTIEANVRVNGSYFNVDEWISDQESTVQNNYTVKDSWIVNSQIDLDKMKYETYDIQDLSGSFIIRENDIMINKATAQINDSDVSAEGYLSNTAKFAMSADTLLGELIVNSKSFNATKFISTSSQDAETQANTLRIPQNVKLIVNAKSDKVLYEDYVLSDFDSKIYVSEGAVSLQNAKANGFDGALSFDGLYDSKPEQPAFSMKYNLDKLNFSKLYQSSNMFKKLAPLAKYVNGYFNSDLEMSGNIDENFKPVLNKISADGFVETLNSQITGFPPLQSLANSLGIQSLKDFAIKNTRNWLTIKDGRVIVKPVKHVVEDINMTISGSHSLTQEINYILQMEIPRKLFKNNDGLAVLDKGLDNLSSEATKLGIDIFSGDYIYVKAEISGTILKPVIKIKPTGSGGKNLSQQAEDALTDRVGEIKNEYEDKANTKIKETKDTISGIVDKEVKKAQDKIDTLVNETKDKITDKATDIINKQIDSTMTNMLPDSLKNNVKDKLNDILNSDGKESDKLKEELDKLNPFKKKKKKN